MLVQQKHASKCWKKWHPDRDCFSNHETLEKTATKCFLPMHLEYFSMVHAFKAELSAMNIIAEQL